MSIWQRYFLPPVTFMSVVIGGGYATGRELVEFFMPAGPVGGLLGMLVTALIWGAVFALSLELARSTGSFEYRSFFRQLLGRGWFLFELVYVALLVLILAVLGAACGEIVADQLGAQRWIGTTLFLVCIAALVWSGSSIIEGFFSAWGIVLYVAYALLFGACLLAFDDEIAQSLHRADAVQSGWLTGGLKYAGYNLVTAPALLFCARHQHRRRESLISGALAGPIAMLPGALFFLAMLARYPEIAAAPVPLQVLLRALDFGWLAVLIQLAIFGTLVQTGIGVLHGFNERLLGPSPQSANGGTANRARGLRLAISIGVSLIAIVLATRIGLVDLIAKGYGYLSWAVLAIYVVPLLTVGLVRLFASPGATVRAS
jgi:uncharacterized membrane protein YkvI